MIFDNELKKRVALDCKDFERYLGTLIDNHLSWKQHINHVAIKISQTIGLISKLQSFVPRHTLTTPYLTWSMIAWGQACKLYLGNLCKHQKHALCFLFFLMATTIQFLYLPMPQFYHNNSPTMNLQQIWCLTSDIKMYLTAFKNSSKIFLRSILLIPNLLLLTTFVNKVLDYQVNNILFPELEQKFEMRCL